MKLKFILSFTLLLVTTTTATFLYSQITIGNIEKKEEKIVLKPAPYDSLNDFKIQKKDVDNLQYVGLQFYEPPDESNDKGTYYTLLNVYYGKMLDTIKINIPNRTVAYPGEVFFKLRNDKTTETTLYNSLYGFIFVPYFVKQKQLYQNNYLIVGGSKAEKSDIVTNKIVTVEKGSKWLCSEVTLLKKIQAFPNGDYYKRYPEAGNGYSVFYILKNDKGETVAFDKIQGGWDDKHIDYNNNFILEKDIIKRQKELKLKQEELIAKQKQEEKNRKEKERIAKEKHTIDCISKFGQYNGELIAQSKVKIGMTPEMCKISWSEPFWKSRTVTEYGVYENWYYGFGFSLHFKNGLLNRIEE